MNNIKLFFLFLILISTACGDRREVVFSENKANVPPSFVSMDVDLPVTELELLIDEKLPKKLLDNKGIKLKKKSDTLFLSLSRYGVMDMAYREGSLYIALPLDVSAVIKKKVMGLTLTNEGQPLTFKGIARIAAEVSLTDTWDFNFNCEWKGLVWDEPPVFEMMGLSLDLTELVDELLTKNAYEIEEIICRKVNEEIRFRETIQKIYYDIQKPNRITRSPFELYLSTEGRGIRGALKRDKTDTLSMHVELQSSIYIKPHSRKSMADFTNITDRVNPINRENSLSAFVELFVTHTELKEKLDMLIDQQKFDYQGYEVSISVDSIFSEKGRLSLLFNVSGDINGKLSLMGKPEISEDLNLSFNSFEYELIDVKEDWVSATDKAMHRALERYLEGLLQVDAFGFFSELDEKARAGIKKSKLGSKMDIDLRFGSIFPYESRITEEGIQIILQVDGSASIVLNKNVFERKRN